CAAPIGHDVRLRGCRVITRAAAIAFSLIAESVRANAAPGSPSKSYFTCCGGGRLLRAPTNLPVIPAAQSVEVGGERCGPGYHSTAGLRMTVASRQRRDSIAARVALGLE